MKFSFALLFLLFIFQTSFSKDLSVLSNIKWLGQAGIRIEDKAIIYIDPYNIKKDSIKADIILITHDHMDHFDRKSIEIIARTNTILLLPEGIKPDIKRIKIEYVKPFLTNEIMGYKIVAVPAYNVKKKFHPKEKGYVGYVIDINGVKIYHTGDTERIPEMKSITADIILLPLGQTYTMNSVEEAVEVVKDVKASVAIPIHFGLYEGNKNDALKFKKLLEGEKKVLILNVKK